MASSVQSLFFGRPTGRFTGAVGNGSVAHWLGSEYVSLLLKKVVSFLSMLKTLRPT